MYDLTMFNLGESLKQLRKKNGITLEEMGKLLSKSKPTIYKYEENQVIPDMRTILEICNIFSITISDLFEFNEIQKDLSRQKNPFGESKLYLYYRGVSKKLIYSQLTITRLENIEKVVFKNSKKTKALDEVVNEYVGTLETDNQVAFINLKNNESTNSRFEKTQIIIDLKHKVDNFYIGSINGTTDGNLPTTRKCILSLERIGDDKDMLDFIYDKLALTEDEIYTLSNKGIWNMPVNILED